MTLSKDLTLSGHCYCGSVRYRVEMPAGSEAIFSAYCHCDSCRRAHAAPLYRVIAIDESMFRITGGEDLLTAFTKPAKTITRIFCTRCGSKILNRFPGWTPGGQTPVVFFPDTLEEGLQASLPDSLRPQKNNRPQECVLDWERLAELEHD